MITPIINHPWSISEQAANALQFELAQKVSTNDANVDVRFIAGVDVAYHKESDLLIAAVAILDANTLALVEVASAEDHVQFPYIPGLFSFREIPPLIKAFAMLKHTPDLIVCDGQGIAHPRRFGLACHIGVIFDVPTIGCGKSKLIGEATEPDDTRGCFSEIIDQGTIVGRVLRTQSKIKPVFVSVGHKISLNSATDWILKLTPQYRLPESTRQADHAVREMLKNKLVAAPLPT